MQQTSIDEVKEHLKSELGWNNLMDGIRMKFIKEVDGRMASMKTVVTCDYLLYLVDNNKNLLSDTAIEIASDEQFMVGEADAVPGLELPIRHSKVGDIFCVYCDSRFGFGPSGRPAFTNPKNFNNSKFYIIYC